MDCFIQNGEKKVLGLANNYLKQTLSIECYLRLGLISKDMKGIRGVG